MSITAWNSNAALGSLKLPNWIVVLVAGGIALLSWLTARGVWKAPSALPIALTAYGLAHAGFNSLCWFSPGIRRLELACS
jgi:hypothetical protein